MGEPERTFTTPEVVELTGLTYRRLLYWVEMRAVTPTIPPRGSGSRITWSRADVDRLRAITEFVHGMELLVDRVPTDTIRKVWNGLATDGVWRFSNGCVTIRVEHPF